MVIDFKKIERRTIQYWFEDGIWEMAFGGWILLSGIFTFGFALTPGKPFWRALGWFGLLAVIILSARFAGQAVRRLKEKWTYSRAGFVSYRRPGSQERPRRFSWVGALAGFASALTYGLLRDLVGYSWAQAGLGLLMTLALFYTAMRTNLIRFYVLSVLLLAAGIFVGIFVARSGLNALSGLGVLCCLLGLALFTSGAITLRRFIRKNPILKRDES